MAYGFLVFVKFRERAVRYTRAFKGLISPPSEPPGEIMSFGVSPVNYSGVMLSSITLFVLGIPLSSY